MLRYLFHRILVFLPTLILISWIAFGLSKMSPTDPVERLCQPSDEGNFNDVQLQEKECQAIAAELGLDKPAFYAMLRPTAFPDTLYKIYNLNQRTARQNLIAQYGNWETIQNYFNTLTTFQKAFLELPDTINRDLIIPIREQIDALQFQYKDEAIAFLLNDLQEKSQQEKKAFSSLEMPLRQVQNAYQKIKKTTTPHLLYIPTIHWYGIDNQYHHWVCNFFMGDFGISYYDRRPVSTRIWEALSWTLIINIISILLAYLIAIPLGVFAAAKNGLWQERSVSTFLFMLYALPSFWVGTMLIVFFTTAEYGMDFFPTGGLGKVPDDAPFWNRFWDTAYHLILPIFCVTYTAFALITRQVRGGMLDVLSQLYITTAKAKGLSRFKVNWKHGFRNALFPVITLFASVFPSTLAGSVIIEVIFSIPGMGRLAFEALFQADWPIVYTVLMLAAILTMLGNLVADILYNWADPRVQFSKK